MLYITYIVDILLLFIVPISLGIYLVKKRYLEGRWWWIAAFIYILSQILILPLQNYLINPYLNGLSYSGNLPSMSILIFGGILQGLSIGVIEETLRFCMFKWWTKDARTFESGLLLGAGHAGAGSIILGFLVLYNFVNMAYVRNIDLQSYFSAEQIQYVQTQISAFWSAPWYYTLREAIGQIFMLVVNISLAIMLLQVFLRKQWQWMMFAILFHTAIEATRVITLNLANDFAANIIMGVYAIIGVLIILVIYRTQTYQINLNGIEQTG
jgi:uncharacterized membrane protein YhfC